MSFEGAAEGFAFGDHATIERRLEFGITGEESFLGALDLGEELEGVGKAPALFVEESGQFGDAFEPVAGVAEGGLEFRGIDGHAVVLGGQEQGERGAAFFVCRAGVFGGSVAEPAGAADDGAAEADGAAQFEFTFDHGLGEARDPAAGGEQAGANIIGELEAGAFVGGRLEQLAEGGEVVEAEHVLRVVAVGDPVFLADAAGMDEGADAEEECVGIEVAAIVEMAVDVVAMGELLAGERPDAGEEQAEAFVFDVEAVEAFALGGRLFPLALPESADVEEMFERVVGRTDTFTELLGQSPGIMDGPHVQERVELFVREPGHIVEAEGQGEAGEPATAFERVRMQHLALEFEQERVGLEGVGEQKGEVIVRMGRHLRPAGAAEGDQGERLVVAKSLLLFGGPVADQGGVDGRALGGDLAAVVERGTPDEGVVLGDQMLEGRQGTEFGDRVKDAGFLRKHDGRPFTHRRCSDATWREDSPGRSPRTARKTVELADFRMLAQSPLIKLSWAVASRSISTSLAMANSVAEAWVKGESGWFADGDPREVGMPGIQQEVEFFGNDGAGHGEDGGTILAHPRIAHLAGDVRGHFLTPAGGQTVRGQSFHQGLSELDAKDQMVRGIPGIEVHQYFEHGQRFVFADVNHRHARRIPASARLPRALAREGAIGVSGFDDAPGDGHQE